MRRVRSRYVAEILDADVSGAVAVHRDQVRSRPDARGRRCGQDGPLRGQALARLAGGLAAAIAAIHAAGVVHRDLKPGNVMLCRRAAGGDRLRHRAHPRLDPADPDRHGDGHARVPGAGGHRGPAEQRRVRRALVGRHGGVRRDRQAAVRGRDVPDDLLPRAAGEGGADGRARARCCRWSWRRWPSIRGSGRRPGGWPSAAPGSAGRRPAAGRRAWHAASRRAPGMPERSRLRAPTGLRAAAARYRGPAEAAADVADLLPPVDYSRPARPARRGRRRPRTARGRPPRPARRSPGTAWSCWRSGSWRRGAQRPASVRRDRARARGDHPAASGGPGAVGAGGRGVPCAAPRPSDIVIVIVDRAVDRRPRTPHDRAAGAAGADGGRGGRGGVGRCSRTPARCPRRAAGRRAPRWRSTLSGSGRGRRGVSCAGCRPR